MQQSNQYGDFDDQDPNQQQQYISPFLLPTDEEVFITRETERQKKKQAKQLTKNLKIWDKKTASSRQPLKRFKEEEIPSAADQANQPYNPLNNHRKLINQAKQIVKSRVNIPSDQKQQNIHQFLEQKKEMFLVGMSLNNIKDQIEVYKEKIRRKDIALEESAAQLSADQIKLDQIFTNDKKETAQKQNRAAAKEKLRKQREGQLKIYDQKISVLMTENGKHLDSLQYMTKLQDFLYNLMPQLKKERNQVFEREKEKFIKKRLKESDTGMFRSESSLIFSYHSVVHDIDQQGKTKAQIKEQKTNRAGRQFESLYQQGFMYKFQCFYAFIRQIQQLQTIQDRYFQNPDQLNDIFSQLEEKNLILIQHTQQQDQQKQEVRAKFKEIQQKMGKRSEQLKANQRELQRQIEQEYSKCQELTAKSNLRQEMSQQSTFLRRIRQSLINVFQKIDNNTDVNAKSNLDLLTVSLYSFDRLQVIQLKAEKFLGILQNYNQDKVRKKEKDVVNERRSKIRIDKIERDQQKLKEKQDLSLAKLNRPAMKKVGKPAMFRSNPPAKKKIEKVVEKNDESLQLKKYFE